MTNFTRIATSLAMLMTFIPAAGALQAGDKTVTLTDKDTDAKVELAKGEKLLVKLAANPTTGFTWVIASKEDAKLKSAGEPVYEPTKSDKMVAGAGGTQTFTFTAEAAGVVEVELHYKRLFEKDKAPAKTFKFKVTIK